MIVGRDGPAVVLDARACAWLERNANLPALRVKVRGVNPYLADLLAEIAEVADEWRGSVGGSVVGTVVAPQPEPATPLQWLGTRDAAVLLKVSTRAVVKAIAREHLPANRVGRVWQINREDLEHYRATRDERHHR